MCTYSIVRTAAPTTTLCRGTGVDRETLPVLGGSGRAGFPCGVCVLPTEFPMTIKSVMAWKHDRSCRPRHNAHNTPKGTVHFFAPFNFLDVSNHQTYPLKISHKSKSTFCYTWCLKGSLFCLVLCLRYASCRLTGAAAFVWIHFPISKVFQSQASLQSQPTSEDQTVPVSFFKCHTFQGWDEALQPEVES